ncbi:hypothetical protein [Enterococcus sp. HY326]|uniref:hypothetical protein n=1 Tax=Enterococcus sp. HY326 TaxID=2971265 RepID=UPI00223E973E|nr:hypothetical protein [Enterococcus sp. HY326]
MKKRRYNMKRVQTNYYKNAQSGLVILLFLIFFAMISGYITFQTMTAGDLGISIVMLVLTLFATASIIVTAKVSLKAFSRRKQLFEERVPQKLFQLLEEELQDEASQYFESVCVGPSYIINLNPEPFQEVFLKRTKLSRIQVDKVQAGTKYRYWSHRIRVYVPGKSMEIYIINEQVKNDFLAMVGK